MWRAMALRARSTKAPALKTLAASRCGVCTRSRTVPVARRSCSSNQRSTSKPCGFALPCGRLKRTTHCQRSPGANVGGGPSLLPYQVKDTWCGTIAPGVSTCSTSKEKRTPGAPMPDTANGRSRTTPVKRTSTPSQALGKASASRACARTCAHAKPSTKARSTQTTCAKMPRPRAPITHIASTAAAAIHQKNGPDTAPPTKGTPPASVHKRACCCKTPAPTANATASQRVMA